MNRLLRFGEIENLSGFFRIFVCEAWSERAILLGVRPESKFLCAMHGVGERSLGWEARINLYLFSNFSNPKLVYSQSHKP